MRKFRDAGLAALRAEGYAVDFTLEKGASPTLRLMREREEDGADEVVDVGTWTSDVIEEYVRSRVASARDELSARAEDER